MLKNPVLKYYGSKFRLAKWILKHFPSHVHYVEAFGGGGSILFQKEISLIETYNDLDGDVCNFFQVLRERPDELIRQIRLTPWARNEYEKCMVNVTGAAVDDISLENARRLYVRLWMSRHAGTLATAAAWRRNFNKRSPALDLRPYIIYDAARRLGLVQIENRDAFKLIKECDSPATLFYLDPPYVKATRSDKNRYACEMDDEKHRELAEIASGLKGCVVLSGYPSDLYREIYENRGWVRIDTDAMANGGVKRVESLWLNKETVLALEP